MTSQAASVAWPDRRADIMESLSALVTLRPGEPQPSMPDLTNAIHWLIDDTYWDRNPPSQDIGLLLRDAAEADAITAVIGPLMRILDELGPYLHDDAYLSHARWAVVRAHARVALSLLMSNH